MNPNPCPPRGRVSPPPLQRCRALQRLCSGICCRRCVPTVHAVNGQISGLRRDVMAAGGSRGPLLFFPASSVPRGRSLPLPPSACSSGALSAALFSPPLRPSLSHTLTTFAFLPRPTHGQQRSPPLPVTRRGKKEPEKPAEKKKSTQKRPHAQKRRTPTPSAFRPLAASFFSVSLSVPGTENQQRHSFHSNYTFFLIRQGKHKKV